jgi:hypothetical protein
MGIIAKLFLPLAIRIIKSTVKKMTPELRQEVVDFVLEWEKRCLASPNKWDDIVVMAIKSILVIK